MENDTEEIIEIKDEPVEETESVGLVLGEPSQNGFRRTFFAVDSKTDGRGIVLLEDFISAASLNTTVTATTTKTAIASFTLPAYKLRVNSVIRITARGHYSNTDGASVVTMYLEFGTNPPATATSAATWGSPVGAAAIKPWNASWTGIIKSQGTSGTLDSQLVASMKGVNCDSSNDSDVTINTMARNTFSVSVEWDSDHADNSITIRQFIVEVF